MAQKPTKKNVRTLQRRMNAFTREWRLGLQPLKVDGQMGPATKRRTQWVRYFMGAGTSTINGQDNDYTLVLLRALVNYKKPFPGENRMENLRRRRTAARRMRHRRKVVADKRPRVRGTSPGAPHWGGSIYVVEATDHIAQRLGHPVTSTKRWPPIGGNFSSWHNTTQTTAYAKDYGTFNGSGHAQDIRTFWGSHAEASGTYAIYYVKMDGGVYRKQTLWAVSGHYDHVHDGASR